MSDRKRRRVGEEATTSDPVHHSEGHVVTSRRIMTRNRPIIPTTAIPTTTTGPRMPPTGKSAPIPHSETTWKRRKKPSEKNEKPQEFEGLPPLDPQKEESIRSRAEKRWLATEPVGNSAEYKLLGGARTSLLVYQNKLVYNARNCRTDRAKKKNTKRMLAQYSKAKEEKKFLCNVCNIAFRNMLKLNEHNARVHTVDVIPNAVVTTGQLNPFKIARITRLQAIAEAEENVKEEAEMKETLDQLDMHLKYNNHYYNFYIIVGLDVAIVMGKISSAVSPCDRLIKKPLKSPQDILLWIPILQKYIPEIEIYMGTVEGRYDVCGGMMKKELPKWHESGKILFLVGLKTWTHANPSILREFALTYESIAIIRENLMEKPSRGHYQLVNRHSVKKALINNLTGSLRLDGEEEAEEEENVELNPDIKHHIRYVARRTTLFPPLHFSPPVIPQELGHPEWFHGLTPKAEITRLYFDSCKNKSCSICKQYP